VRVHLTKNSIYFLNCISVITVVSVKKRSIQNLLEVYDSHVQLRMVLRPILGQYIFGSDDDNVIAEVFTKLNVPKTSEDLALQVIFDIINADYDTLMSDIISWKKASRKPDGIQTTRAGFGQEVVASIRCVYSSLLTPSKVDELFCDYSNHPLIIAILVLVSSNLTNIFTFAELFTALSGLPSGRLIYVIFTSIFPLFLPFVTYFSKFGKLV